MSSIAKASISFSKKDLQKSRVPPVAFRNVAFYHKATVSDLIINLLSLNFPSSEMPTAVQATADELSGARLSINKKNLSLVSSAKGQLIQGLDYIVVDSMTIVLIGPYDSIGAEIDEIFVGTINCAPVSDLVVASAKNVTRSYTLAVGQTTLNLAQEYQVNIFPNENIGIIKIFVNGVLANRNTGNSSVTLDKDYYEVDSGNGFGTTVIFNVAPSSTAYDIVVDFGVMAITDNNAIGTIESLTGSIKKLADDVAVMAGTTASDYYNASPSEVERRVFGDMVLEHEADITDLQANKANLNGNNAQLFNVANAVSATNAVALGQFGALLAEDGYQRFPSGLILQWGYSSVWAAVTFPIAFPNAAFSVVSTFRGSSHEHGVTSVTTTGFSPTTNGNTSAFYWFAVGY
jgi:hypothetical protein